MKDQSKTKQVLIQELVSLRHRISELERSESERKRVDKQILAAHERLQYLLSSTAVVIYAAKPSGEYGATFISENVARMVGYNPEEFIRDSNFWFDHIHPEDQPIISEEAPKIAALQFPHFYVQLKIEWDRSNRYEQPLTLLLLDLDNFKTFNDTYGHVEGDQVLRRLGQVVKRCLRETDLAYRYGGEEFTILLPMTTSADGAVTAERIRTEFKKEHFFPASDQDVHVTVSIGIAQYKPQEEMKVFVHRVDQLTYQGKKNGKDRVCAE